jgi:hypothetical protein
MTLFATRALGKRTAFTGGQDVSLLESVKKRLCSFQILGIEPFRDPVVDRLEERERLSARA